MFPQIHQGVMNPWNILRKFLKVEEIVKYSNGWNLLSTKPQIKRIKDCKIKKREESKEAPVAFTRKPQTSQPPQEAKKNKKKSFRKLYSPSYRIQGIQKDTKDTAFHFARTFMEFKDKVEKKIRQPHLPKK
ncbi:hypothetical protein O181_010873 [Austropuccinia psidii MF-1]|uniref:Uncharacterized protein n=1 Tax=Austropuccinia psidii MF-1 TaxID=1389203 RepID=A0A9Q3GKT2_9BASI|nr:hypothetical protein [Austropuccinia psidii MF-1]